ncbi:MAG: COX15/CtaA family protein [Gammaproteobacteria bacterium]
MHAQLKKLLPWLLYALPALALLTASLGAWTRLVHAGLGCPDWPGCYGFTWLPETSADIDLANTRYPDTPYEADKALWEVVHRYFAALTGLVIFLTATVLYAERITKLPAQQVQQMQRLAVFACVWVLIQGFFGYLTVSLKLWPQIVTAHLLGGLLLVSLCWRLLMTSQLIAALKVALPPRLVPLIWLTLLAVLVQICLGAWVSSNYAALACTDFPLCQGNLWPPTDFASGFNLTNPPGPNYLFGQLDNEARTSIHLAHRLGALAAAAMLIWLSCALFRTGYHRWGATLLSLTALQITLGILNVLWVLPLAIAVGHHLGAFLLWLGLLTLLPVAIASTGRQ